MVTLTLDIENHYGDEVVTTEVEVTVPAPPPDTDGEDAMREWADEHLYPLTGTGRTEGDAAYFVSIGRSSRPELMLCGREFEWGT
jgi:hypothetical protein